MSVSAAEQKPTLLILGDSLSAGYQMKTEQSWPWLLPSELARLEKDVHVVNASVSGDTTGNGLSRLPQLLTQHAPDWVLIELGANDGLRGFNPNIITNNLIQIIALSQQSDAQVLLMQIQVPPNYGKRYSQSFAQIYPIIAETYNIPLLPFFLEPIITRDDWIMADGLHPKPEAQPWIAHFMSEQLVTHL